MLKMIGRPGSNGIRVLLIVLLLAIGALAVIALRAYTSTPELKSTTEPTSKPTSTFEPTSESFATPPPIFISTTAPGLATSPQIAQFKQKWLSGSPCAPPCWEGITPGKTSAIEAGNILSANPMFTMVDVAKSPLPLIYMGFVDYKWNVQLEDGTLAEWGGDALFDYSSPDQIIYEIRPGIPNMRLGELIQAFGDPSHIVAYEEAPTDIGGPYTWSVNIVWLPKGLAIDAAASTSEPQINADLIMRNTAEYFPPTLDGYERATNAFQRNYLKPWQGYGDFKEYSLLTPIP